ncbi:hypothetical protein TgHK011_009770 [Trichoderma gracile]|nr:hypothetical protein TgHK011_009770 [Trichoderma gracile]
MMSAVSSFSDSHEVLGVPRTSYHRLARKCRRNVSPSISTTTALVSAALTSAAPVVKFEPRRTRVFFVPEIPKPSHSTSTLSHFASGSQAPVSTAVGGQGASPLIPSPEPAVLHPGPRISIRTASIDEALPHQAPSATETLWKSSSEESLASSSPSPATTISLTSPLLDVPIPSHSPRQNRFSRGHSPASPLRNVSHDSHFSKNSLRTTSSPVSNGVDDLLQAIGSMVDKHVRQLRGSLLSPVGKSLRSQRDHCREALISLQQPIHSLLQRQATDPTYTLHHRELFELYHELREILVDFQHDLSVERISDNYCEDFCNYIAAYRRRLAPSVVATW